ncbi:MAG: GAF domain-containing protein, partial [Xanthomonadales bacterium]|nr:GAF domain-containing protein [Xanthomonadales bacterium]
MTISQAITPPRLSQDALARILDVTQQLAQPHDLIHMLTEVVEAGESVLSADKGALWIYDAARDDLTMRVPEFKPAPRLRAGEGLAGECLSRREIINVANAYADTRFSRTVDKATGYKTHSVLNVHLLGW